MKWLTNFLKCLFAQPGRIIIDDSLQGLGYPTHEELGSIGLSGHDFMERYITCEPRRRSDSVEQFADRVLGRFYADYPQLTRRRR